MGSVSCRWVASREGSPIAKPDERPAAADENCMNTTTADQEAQLTPQESSLSSTDSDSCLQEVNEENIPRDIVNHVEQVDIEPVAKCKQVDPRPSWGNTLLKVMKTRYKELAVIIVVTLSLLTALKEGHLMTRKTGRPVKFFDSKSLVTDFEFGQLQECMNLAEENEVTFVMFYAPWDLDSQRFRREFDIVAKHYGNQVRLAAINCWWPDGQCSKLVKVKRFPVLKAFVRGWGDIEYFGPLSASYIIPFLDNVLDPVISVNSDGELLELRSKHDAVVVGYYDFKGLECPEYQNFRNAAFKSLSVDPWRKVQYAVIISRKVAFKLTILQPSSITIFFWNSTVHVDHDLPDPDSIVRHVNEIFNKHKPLVTWVTPSGVKSNVLSSLLSRGPTLVLFTPRSLILGISPFFEILRETVMDYFNCDKSPIVRSLIHRSILRRVLMEDTLAELDEKCHEELEKSSVVFPTPGSSDSCCFSSSNIKWKPPLRSAVKKCFCTACVQMKLSKCPGDCSSFNCLETASRYLSNFDPNHFINSTASYCNQIKFKFQPRYTPYYSMEVACTGNSEPESATIDASFSILGQATPKDDKIIKMMQSFEEDHCSRLRLGLNYSDLNFPDSGDPSGQSWRRAFTGLACETNKTLAFVAIDSVLFPSFAENIGINLFNESYSTAAVIIEESEENVYVLGKTPRMSLSAALNKKLLYEFIKNYTNNALPRFLKSAKQMTPSPLCASGSICVPEVTSNTFSRMVLDNSRDVVLLYFTPWCGFCSTIAHFYLSIAHFLRDVDPLVFARINVDQNDLPFEFSADRVPLLLYYPSGRKSNSLFFQPTQPITEVNLLNFIVKSASPQVQQMLSMKLCESKKCLQKNLMAMTSHRRRLSRSIRAGICSLGHLSFASLAKNLRKDVQFAKHIKRMLVENKRKLSSASLLSSNIVKKIKNFERESFDQDLSRSLRNILQITGTTNNAVRTTKKPALKQLPAKASKVKVEL